MDTNLKIAIICYHKNIEKIYPKEWIEKFRKSILSQTYNKFDIYETNYGGGNERIFSNSNYSSQYFINFVYCMNDLLDKCFESGYDAVFNTNVDDYYSNDRIERQLIYLKKGYDLISSNFSLVEDDQEVHSHRFHNLNIWRELSRNHNIIAHPVVAYSKKFWENNRYNPDEIPSEDLNLWKRSIINSRFVIIPDYLLFHRLHRNSVCRSENR